MESALVVPRGGIALVTAVHDLRVDRARDPIQDREGDRELGAVVGAVGILAGRAVGRAELIGAPIPAARPCRKALRHVSVLGRGMRRVLVPSFPPKRFLVASQPRAARPLVGADQAPVLIIAGAGANAGADLRLLDVVVLTEMTR